MSRTIAHEPDFSITSPFSCAFSMYTLSAASNPFTSASSGLFGNEGSLITNWWRLSLRKSAQALPPWPSKTPKKLHLGQFSPFLELGLSILSIIDTLSSL